MVRRIISADARIDYREALAIELGLEWDIAKNMDGEQLILAAYMKWGEDCIKHLYGDYAFVIWDERVNQVFGAKDHFGCRPMYYLNHPKYFVIASDLSGLEAVPDFKLQISDQEISA